MIIKLTPKNHNVQHIISELGELWEVNRITLGRADLGISAAYEIHSVLKPAYQLNGMILRNWLWLNVEDDLFDWEIIR